MEDRKTILKTYVGSIASNLYIDPEEDEMFGTCDIDTMEFYVFPKNYYLSLDAYHRNKSSFDYKYDKYDNVGHELRKAVYLLQKGNPNMLATLFAKDDQYIELTEGGFKLIGNRDLFLSATNVRDRFKGYAHSQLKRITSGAYKGYMGEKRKKIVDKFGYDTKNARTLIKLLYEAKELLKNGTLTVFKEGDIRKLLMDIKFGKYSLQDIKVMSEDLSSEVDAAYNNTVLPEKIDKDKVNKLLIEILELEVFNQKPIY